MTTEERLENLEKGLARARWFNRCLIACIVLGFGVWFILKTFGPQTAWVQSGAKQIQANSFGLVDENGKPRALLYASKDRPGLGLYDENGKTRAALNLLKYGPELSLIDENGKDRALLTVSEEGPELVLLDENGETRAVLTVNKLGPWLALLDENGKVVWSAP